MDPLSISASFIALLQLSGKVIGYLSDVKGGPKELLTIRLEICGILPILSILQDQAEQARNGDLWSPTFLSLDVPNGPIQQFRRALEQLESNLAPVGGWKKVGKAFSWPFEKGEIQRILSTIERQKLLFTLARQNDHIGLAKAIRGEVQAVQQRVNKIAEGVARLDLCEKHHKLRLWLSGPDPSSNYNMALRKRHGGTGSWLINNDVFRDWKQDPGPGSIIWLYGIPGCGKTILCSTILEHVLQDYAWTPGTAVLYFFFDFNNIDKQQHEAMIRSLLSQLFMHCVNIPTALEALYSSCMDGGRKPTFDALLETLHQMTTIFENTFIILDALDECGEQLELLTDIEELVSWKDTNLRILATSRRQKDIEDAMLHLTKGENRICIQSALIDTDIRAYVHDQLQTNKKLQRWQKEPKVQMEIEDILMKKANGMFRWVECQFDSLGSCLTLPKLRKALATLPRTLNDTYARILCDIDKDYQQYALHILQWLAFSELPLRLEEIAEVIAIDVNETPKFDPQRRLPDPRDVVEICSSLFTVTLGPSDDAELEEGNLEPSESFVRLAHFSVKEYLTSDIIRQGQAVHFSLQETDCHLSLAKDCLAYLLHLDEVGSLTSEVFAEYPLARYIAGKWTAHARVGEKKDRKLCRDFFMTTGEAFINWIRLLDPESPCESDLSRSPSNIASPLYYASITRLLESVRMLLEEGADINAEGGTYRTALIAASSRGYTEIVQVLLEKGANVDTTSYFHGTALIVASSRGYIEIVQMLLEKGADVNARRKRYPGNALLVAIASHNKELARLLIEKGADVTGRDDFLDSPLACASYNGLQEIVELILEKGVDTELQIKKYSQALAKASRGGQQKIVQILLRKGAVINSKVINAALEGESVKILQMLFNHGGNLGDPSRQDAQGRSLCHHASAQNSITKLEMLLKFGSDLAVADKQGRTCLHHAATNEDSAARDAKRRSLERKVYTGRPFLFSTVAWLLKKGFDPNLPDRDGWTALHWAAKRGDAETVKILEDVGAEFSVENIMGWTPDDVATFHHHKISWNTNTALGCGVERSKLGLEDGPSTANLEAGAESAGGQIRPGNTHWYAFCRGCDLGIIGPRYLCMTCRESRNSFDYCFKCKQSSDDTHPGHFFIESF